MKYYAYNLTSLYCGEDNVFHYERTIEFMKCNDEEKLFRLFGSNGEAEIFNSFEDLISYYKKDIKCPATHDAFSLDDDEMKIISDIYKQYKDLV